MVDDTRDPLHRAIEHHWREYRPRMVAALQETGTLYEAIEYAANRTVDGESALIRQGVSPHQAQELIREEWAFLPSEEDVPQLPNGGPDTWQDQKRHTLAHVNARARK